jgi:RecT family
MTVTTLPTAQAHPTPAIVPMPHRAGPLSLGQMSPADAWRFAEALAGTPLLPDAYRKQPASVLWAMEYGRALGLDVVTTITTIHVIKGRPTQSADLMLSRARQAGHRIRIKAERTRCVVKAVRADDPDDETEIEWTLDDAVTARLCELRDGRTYARDQKGQPTSWEKYPRAMLRSRAIAEAVRTACPEVLHGAIYTPEELGAVVDQDGNAIADVPAAPQYIESTVVERVPDAAPEQHQTPAGRDYLAEAHTAPDAATVRFIWRDAKAEGARPEYLAQIAEVGQQKAAVEHAEDPAPDITARGEMYRAADAAGVSPDKVDSGFEARYGRSPIWGTAEQLREYAAAIAVTDAAGEASWQGEPTKRAATEERARAEAESALRVAASRAHLTDLDDAFSRVYGLPIAEAPVHQLDTFRQKIEAAK